MKGVLFSKSNLNRDLFVIRSFKKSAEEIMQEEVVSNIFRTFDFEVAV